MYKRQNLDLARQYAAAAEEIRAQVGGQPLSIDALSRLPDVFTARHAQLDEEQLWQDVKAVADEAVKNFIAMRAAEGEKLKEDILGRLDTLEGLSLIHICAFRAPVRRLQHPRGDGGEHPGLWPQQQRRRGRRSA